MNRISWDTAATTLAIAILCACTTAPAEREHTTVNEDKVESQRGIESAEGLMARVFDDVEGTFVLFDAQSGQWTRHNPERAETPFVPASTFKIANTIIALETGVATDGAFALQRDEEVAPQQSWWPTAWAEDHTLSTAFTNSVVWYYQELARRIGAEQMSAYLEQFGYGNASIGGGVDRFWLSGDLRTTANEQVDFLRRFYDGQLGVSEPTTTLTREILVLDETPGYRLSAKTGWAGFGRQDRAQIGWLVGYLERGADVYFFAMNIDIGDSDEAAARQAITRGIFRELGLLD